MSVAFCKLPIVGCAVSLADSDTLADKSSLELVDSHCNEPCIPRNAVSPVASSLSLPFSLWIFLGRLYSAVDSFEVNSCWSSLTE